MIQHEDKLVAICKNYILPKKDRATVSEPYIPYIPKSWNGVLVLAEAQNHGEKAKMTYLGDIRRSLGLFGLIQNGLSWASAATRYSLLVTP